MPETSALEVNHVKAGNCQHSTALKVLHLRFLRKLKLP